MPQVTQQGTIERVYMSASFVVEKNLEGTRVKKGDPLLYVKGFASIKGEDRHGTDIDPKYFDLESYMRNPQLWFNHRLWERERKSDGAVLEVPVGTVERAYKAVVRFSADGHSFTVNDLDNEEAIIDTIVDVSRFNVKDADRGIWVVAGVIEPEPAELVDDGRINAFSWAGLIYRNPDGRISKIDIMEVSLVFLPANARALLMIGRDVGWEPETDFLLTEHGVLFPLSQEPKAEFGDCRNMPAYRFVVIKNSSSYTIAHMDSCDRDTAQAYALTLMEKSKAAAVGILKSQWKRTKDGAYLYKLIDMVTAKQNESNDAEEQPMPPAAYIDDLADDCFAFIEPGAKDSEGKTVPRKLRHFVYKDHTGTVHKSWLQQAIRSARLSAFGSAAVGKLKEAAAAMGLELKDLHLRACGEPLDEIELGLLQQAHSNASTQKGGEDMTAEEMQKLLEPIQAGVSKLDEGMTTLTERVAAIEAAKAKEDPKKKPYKKDEDSDDPSKKSTTAQDDDPKQPTAKSDDDALKVVVDAIKGVDEKITSTSKSINELASRVAKLETAPGTARSVDEEDDDDEPETVTERMQKAFEALPKEKQKTVRRDALAATLFGTPSARIGVE